MISPADSDLARRDRAIPGLALVLDPDAFVTALRRAAPKADLQSAQINEARYKPHSSCRVSYRLGIAGAELDAEARACRPDDLAEWRDAGEPTDLARSLGPGRMVLEDCAVVVTIFPYDLKLRTLQGLTDPVKREQLLRELLPDQPGFWKSQPNCLRYVPERRYVAELRAPDGKRALLKSYTRKAYGRSKLNALAFQSREPLRIARLIGYSDRHRMLAFEWVPGHAMLDLCGDPESARNATTLTSAALAAFHSQRPDGLVRWNCEAETAYVSRLFEELGHICPHLAKRADQLARRLLVQLEGDSARQASLHGDFSMSQVLVNGEAVAIIDLDWACSGDPADDLGNFLSQIEQFTLRGRLSPNQCESLREALLEGYSQANNGVLPERIKSYTALGLCRRARFQFRTREPDWPQRTEALLARAEQRLKEDEERG